MENIKAVLQTTASRWHTLTQTIPADLLKRKPIPSEWSALECLLHLTEMDQLVFGKRINAILAGEDFPAFFPDEEGATLSADTNPSELAAEFKAIRNENLKLLETIQAEDLGKTATHAELGVVSLKNLLNEWAGHDLMHLVQAEQALMQPFIEECGAWQVYFEEHVVK